MLHIFPFCKIVYEMSDTWRHCLWRGYLWKFVVGWDAQPFGDESSGPLDFRLQKLRYFTGKLSCPVHYSCPDFFFEQTGQFFSGRVDLAVVENSVG